MSVKVKIKQSMLIFLGENAATWIHSLRFYYLILANKNQEIEIQLLRLLDLSNKVAIDIGANSANWTVPLAKAVGKLGKVFAFEADPYYAIATEKTLELFGVKNVIFFPYGLSDKEEMLPLKIYDEFQQRVAGTSHFVADKNLPGTVLVPLYPLDSFIEAFPLLLQTAFIKCDVEGFEPRVFHGARKIIQTARPIVVSEMNPESDVAFVFKFFKDINYYCYVAVSSSTLRSSDKAGDISEGRRPNRIFIPVEFRMPGNITIAG